MKKIVTMLVVLAMCFALLITPMQSAFAAEQTVSETTVCVADATNSYLVDNYGKTVKAVSGNDNVNIKSTWMGSKYAYLHFELTPELVEKIKTADKLNVRLNTHCSNANTKISIKKVKTWGNTSNNTSWEEGETIATGTHTTANTYVWTSIDISSIISELSDDASYLRLAVTANDPGSNGLLRTKDNTVLPQLEIENSYSTQPAEFYGEKEISIKGTNPVCVDADSPSTKATLSSSGLLYLRNNGNDNLLFITFDLTDVNKESINSVVLKNAVYRNGGDQKIRVTEVTSPYSEINGSYTLSETSYAISEQCPWQTFETDTKTDLTDMVKNSTGNSITVCIQSEGTFTASQEIAVSNRYYTNPEISVKCSDNIENLNNISDYFEIVAKRIVIEGDASNPISAIPIVALYDEGALVTVKIGESLTLNGSLNTITESVSVPATYGEFTDPKLSMFVWTSLDELVPVLDSNSIE